MNPAYPSLPAVSWELVVVAILAVLFVLIIIVGGALRLATKWVAGFTPPWGRTCGAILCSYILNFIGGMVYGRIFGKAGIIDPRFFLWMITVGFFLQVLSYKAVLAGEDIAEEISVAQAILISILQRIILIVPLVVIVASLLFFIGANQFSQILAKQSLGGLSPSGVTPRSAPAFPTIADAQKEAVRRYPQLGVRGSRFNKAYVDRYHLYQKTRPDYFADNSWPIRLADEMANDPAVR
jgi:hypothetical protein